MSLEGLVKALGSIIAYEEGPVDPKGNREEHDRLAIDWLKKMTSQMKPEWWEPMGEAQRKKVASAAAKAAATWPREVQEAIFQALQSI